MANENANAEEDEDLVQCEVCGEHLTLDAYPDHIGDHIVPLVADRDHLMAAAPGTPPRLQSVPLALNYRVFPSVMLLMWDQGYLDENDDYEFLTRLGEMIGDVPRGFKDDELDQIMVPISLARPDADHLCAVCQETMTRDTEAVQLLCSHAFCKSCIQTWLKLRRTCPVCVVDLETLK